MRRQAGVHVVHCCSPSAGEYLSQHERCHLCDITCLQCNGPQIEDCTSCPATRFFDDGCCVIRCQSGRYATGRQCHVCHHTCKECTDEGPDSCTSCDRGRNGEARYFFEGQCRDVCPEGHFHSKWSRCEPCPADCLICTSADRCLQCSPGNKLRNGLCVPLECSEGEVADAEKEHCLHCDEGCKQCKRSDSGDQTVCTKCEDGFYQLGTECHQSCPDQTYSVDDTMVCAPCEDRQCEICDDSECNWCKDGFYVFDGKCVDHCTEGFFMDEESRECEPCHRACRSCGGPRYDDCDTCEDEFTLKDGECLEARQLVLCPEQHFRNNKGECELCHSICKTCSGAWKENCNSCHAGHFLTAQQTCMSRCPTGTFANKTSSRCDDCSKGCITCQDSQQCQRCRSGLYLHNGMCVVECQRGFPQNGACHPCAPECTSCRGNSSYCHGCETPYLLLDHSCRSHCLQGYYATETECQHCPAHCKECVQGGLCKNCDRFYFLHKDTCVDDCPNGYFASDEQQECVQCHADCASCDGPDIDDCVSCRNKKAVRFNGECLPQCPKNTFYDKTTNECRECDKSCLTCSGHEPSSCLSCGTDRRLDASGHCVWFRECSLDSYKDQNGECRQCHTLCHRCSGPSKDDCLSCNLPHFLLNSTCMSKCPVSFYAEDEDERVCERCHFSCDTCAGRHSVQCVTCKRGFFKQGSNCVEVCSSSHFGNVSTMVCERCDPSCDQCWGPGNTNCQSCRQDYFYLKHLGQCLQSCPSSYYEERLSKSCHKCHPTCRTCSGMGALACQSCYEGITPRAGICSSPCFVGFYADSQGSKYDDPVCKACDPSCMDCRGPSMWNCTLCPALQILADDGRCLSCCGNETHHHDEVISRECCDCGASREECILGVNFVMRNLEDLEAQGSPAKLFVTFCSLIILSVGGGLFLFLNARSKSLALTPKARVGGYEKVDSNSHIASKPSTSSYGEYSDPIIECEEDEEDSDDVDIVYMTQDGTVYRKFKYGLLDEDEIELEYDDESYSYR